MSNIKAIKHHAEELADAVKPDTEIEAWVLSKSERAETDLSDITHYLDGLKMEKGGYMADGGYNPDKYIVKQAKDGSYKVVNTEIGMYVDYSFKTKADAEDFKREKDMQRKRFGRESYFEDGGYMAKGGTIDYSKQTSDDFKLGEIVWDTDNNRYGTIIGIYDGYLSDKYEVRLDTDGMQPTENLRKVGSEGDNGTKEQLKEEIDGYARLVKSYPENNYPKQIEPISHSKSNSKGGDLSSIKNKYEENEDENAHSENVVLLAKHFGTKEDLAKAKEILALHEKEGSLSSENGKKRQELHLKLIGKARAEMGKQGIEFEKGGYMAEGGETGKETIRLKSYNAYGKEINSGDVVIDYDLKTIKLPNGKTLNVEKDWEYTYKVYKTKIKAIHGISGLAQFLKEINKQDSPFNPSVTNLFINNLEKEKMAKGGMTRKGGQPFEVEGRKFFYHKDDGNVYDSNHRLYAGSYSSLELAKKSLEKNFENIKTGNFYKDGGYMAKGGEFKPYGKTKGKYKIEYTEDGEKQSEVWESKEMVEDRGKRLLKLGHTNIKITELKQMAKGGIYSSDSLYILKVSKDGKEVGEERFRAKNIREAKEMGEDYEEKYKTKFGGDLSFSVKEAMASGGKVKFADKVKSVQESLLKRKKVSPKVQKDYGKTYSKAEAKESAQRIVGSRMAQLKEKMAKKKK
jgi:hypothetical protein